MELSDRKFESQRLSQIIITKAITIHIQKLLTTSTARSCWQFAWFELSNCCTWGDMFVICTVLAIEGWSTSYQLPSCWTWADLLVIYTILDIEDVQLSNCWTCEELLVICTVLAIDRWAAISYQIVGNGQFCW